jgi:hypothetical protein
MRQARNQDRLALAGITLDNNIPSVLPSPIQQTELLANGSVDNSILASLSQTLPAIGTSEATVSAVVDVTAGTIADILITNPGSGYITDPTVVITSSDGGVGAEATATIDPATGEVIDIVVVSPGTGYTTSPLVVLTGGLSGTSTTTAPERYGVFDPATNTYTLTNPIFGGNGQIADTGQATEPGSLAGSPYTRLIPSNLNLLYTSDILLPSTLSPSAAINLVTECNCDCWVSP